MSPHMCSNGVMGACSDNTHKGAGLDVVCSTRHLLVNLVQLLALQEAATSVQSVQPR